MDAGLFAGAVLLGTAAIKLRQSAKAAAAERRKRFIAGIPKAELHLHIEGTFEPELIFEIAKKNGVDPGYPSPAAARAARDFKDLQDFLDMYYKACDALLTRDDFKRLGEAYLRRAAADNVRYVEMFFDPQTHTDRGVAFDDVINGLHDAIVEGERSLGVTGRLILCILRHLDADAAMATLDMAEPHKAKILALGLDSGEAGNPPKKFEAVYKRAADMGFHLVAHAGEEGPAAYISEAIDVLDVRRIDHGVRCLEDDAVVERLVRDKIPLTVCPLSNYKLQVYQRYFGGRNVTGDLLRRGLRVTINSDDPAYFGGYVGDNYLRTADDCDLTEDEIAEIAINGFESAFLPPAAKAKYVAEITNYRKAFE